MVLQHCKSHYGYKLSVSVDLKHGFIRCIATGTASEHDGHHFEEVLDEHNTGRDVYADKAYPSRRRQEMLKVLGWRDGMQRRAAKDKLLAPAQSRSPAGGGGRTGLAVRLLPPRLQQRHMLE